MAKGGGRAGDELSCVRRDSPDRGTNAGLYLLTIFPSVAFGAL